MVENITGGPNKEKKEGKKTKSEGKKGSRGIVYAMIGVSVLGITAAVSYCVGVDKGRPKVVYKGDLNNDGIKDLVTHDIDYNKKIVYICRENGSCVRQDWYLENMKDEMDGKTKEKVDNLKRLIGENLEKYDLKKLYDE